MKSVLKNNGHISAFCPDCKERANFELKNIILAKQGAPHQFESESFRRVIFTFNQCTGCGRGGLGKVHDNENFEGAALESFFPHYIQHYEIPGSIPKEIEREFREAELCLSVRAYRAASALFRSVLEKTLKLNGYVREGKSLKDLQSKIDEAAVDGIITDARKRRAHEEIRALGNDVLHEEWREVTEEDVESAHFYTQRILEDFYDDRLGVEKILKEKRRLVENPESSAE